MMVADGVGEFVAVDGGCGQDEHSAVYVAFERIDFDVVEIELQNHIRYFLDFPQKMFVAKITIFFIKTMKQCIIVSSKFKGEYN